MAIKIRTYVDTSLLIHASEKSTAQTFARKMRSLQILNSLSRSFVASEFLRLEVLPIPTSRKRKREIIFLEAFFLRVEAWAPVEPLISPAMDLACEYGLGAMDALHLCAAKHFDAEFISAEKPTKPIYRAYTNISSIYED